MNDLGDVVAFNSGTNHGMLIQNVVSTDLGASSITTDINNLGQILCLSDSNGGNPFIWENGQRIELNSLLPAGSPWLIRSVWGINDHDQIVGIAENLTTQSYEAVLLNLPEPSTLGLLLICGAVFGARRMVRRRARS